MLLAHLLVPTQSLGASQGMYNGIWDIAVRAYWLNCRQNDLIHMCCVVFTGT